MDLLTLAEAATVAKVSVQTLRNYIRDKRLTEYRRAGRLAVDRAELLTVFAPQRVTPLVSGDMPRVFAIANQKGGTGKTTTASALSFLLGQQAPTLAIDADPQGNLTQSFGLNPDKLEKTLYEVIVNSLPIEEAMQQVPPPPAALWLVGSNLDLAQTTLLVSSRPWWGVLLKDALAPVLPRFRYVVIDCPPSLDALTINALAAATELIVPVEMGAFSLRGTSKLLDVVRDARKLNPNLPAPRFLACRTEATRLSDAIQGELGRNFGGRLFRTTIRKGTVVGQAQLARRPLHQYAPNSQPAHDYSALAKELQDG